MEETLGKRISARRKALGLTQDALAEQLGLTAQAVSKWESDQCCPDVMLLPRIADIFETTVDALFGRGAQPKNEADLSATKKRTHIFLGDSGKASCTAPTPGWPDDNILRVVVYVGQNMVCGGLAEKGWQYFVVIPDIKSVGVKDDSRYEGWPAIIRAVNTKDAMSATIEEIPYEILHKITSRITNEVDGINRVCLDLTPKPIGTIEWE